MTLDELKPGDRVEMHPATDTWMRGDRLATVVRKGTVRVTLLMDRSGHEIRFYPRAVGRVLS